MTWQEHVAKCVYCGKFVALQDTVWLPGIPDLASLDPPDDDAAHAECIKIRDAKIRAWQEAARQEDEAAAKRAGGEG